MEYLKKEKQKKKKYFFIWTRWGGPDPTGLD